MSFYSDERLGEILEIRHAHELTGARNELVDRGLIAFEHGIYQVLDLPAETPQKSERSRFGPRPLDCRLRGRISNRHGYAAYAIDRRLKHLDSLNRFIEARGLQALEAFRRRNGRATSSITGCAIIRRPTKKRRASRYKSRFEPHHHRDVQFSLRCFFRWAHAAGRLQHNPFPLRPPVPDHYFFPEMMDYRVFAKSTRPGQKLMQTDRAVGPPLRPVPALWQE